MGQLMRFAVFGLGLVVTTISSVCNATCWESGEGSTAVYRSPSVPAEFNAAAFVVTGRVLSQRNISTPDDPEGFEWTVYTVEVLEAFKGRPQRTIRLASENSSARFYMDTGETYLVFVSRLPKVVMAGKERLPVYFVDNCGNSASARDAGVTVKAVRALSKVR
ncbi:hypothetical protein [Dyella telluris]|uniref:Uncharacterized protein n=1 Tax=Dyella telluris TaxID=2763498 RepID=A0A7G8Q3E3_9GAMM|nr:hypothetical protein [Dyella telluris]QNK01301.1 hypothetical protein H8F01_20030 [Dyella telluris]